METKLTRFGRGYGELYVEHVTQANEGANFDFLQYGPDAGEPEIHSRRFNPHPRCTPAAVALRRWPGPASTMASFGSRRCTPSRSAPVLAWMTRTENAAFLAFGEVVGQQRAEIARLEGVQVQLAGDRHFHGGRSSWDMRHTALHIRGGDKGIDERRCPQPCAC